MPVLTSFVGLCVLAPAIIVWFAIPGASAESTQVAPLSPLQKVLKPNDTFKDCANCPKMVGGAGWELHDGIADKRAGSFRRRRPTT